MSKVNFREEVFKGDEELQERGDAPGSLGNRKLSALILIWVTVGNRNLDAESPAN